MTYSTVSNLKDINSITDLQKNPNCLNKSIINNIELTNLRTALNYIPIIKIENLKHEVIDVDENKTIISLHSVFVKFLSVICTEFPDIFLGMNNGTNTEINIENILNYLNDYEIIYLFNFLTTR